MAEEPARKWASRTFAIAAFVHLYSALALSWGWLDPTMWVTVNTGFFTVFAGADYLKKRDGVDI